ncbi:MAG: prepilin-type N-terminal cleavage/methylation domain-containing protein [Sulfurospirillaceae bacterium]|nr:prepilin-type N-terminal cleavage/methylation domain-containing protein [Sulfurospirillaceae bacterium]
MIDKKAGTRPAFTMIELIFVIVVIGILSAIAIPRLAASRDDAVLVKAKSQVSAIRSGIAMQKNKRLLEGTTPALLPSLDSVTNYNLANQRLFNYADGNSSNVLEYPIYSKINSDGAWVKTAANKYSIYLRNTTVSFDYNSTSGIFDCSHTDQNCKDLTQ